MSYNLNKSIALSEVIEKANTGADAIKRAPIVEEDTGMKCLRIGDVSNNKPFEEWGYTSASEDVINKFLLKKNDILVARTGNTIGVVKYIDKDINSVYNNGLIRLKVKNNYLPRYIYYNIISDRFKNFIYGISAGTSTQPNMKIDHMLQYEIADFSLEEQKKIVNILSSLDEKIELNNEMNKTLEEMAQALFKRWFVDFEFPNEEGKSYKSSGGEMVESEMGMIPKGWKVEKLQDISIVTMGVSPSSNSYNQDKIGLPLLNGAADFEGKLIKPSKYSSEPKKVCKVGDMVFGVRATIGNTVFADKEYALGRGVASVSPKSDMFREFIYFSLDNSMNKLIANASGSVFLNLKKADITDLKLCFSETIIDKFNKIAKVLINKIIEDDKESEILKEHRDSLLSKLMSGEISVEDIKASL
ncbi:restriction endonuclease subunit S [Clostridium sp. SM-530-WT-3G]|uniref:restriction endonuclease subunit S n=1 Tax=Clostridium sp. SM-530-WT-3G TaxID=2725303 RepID=UPI00145F5EDD|nr:restriction endonuclease subunit S [Clostridium sp. SM-530-WT-3G]NME81851.1 restriction endonuclease subunit S [Clostridium sp. SM-530-WT-3G]